MMESKRTINEQQMLKVGHTLQMGKYRVEALLASGGFGNTYVVTNVKFGERWAMKEFFIKGINGRTDDGVSVSVSQASQVQFESQREKFNKEARRLHNLHHPNIMYVEDLFDENGTSYYIMEYIEGGSLAEKIRRDGPMTEAEVRRLLPPLLDALEHIHAQQMWHLDLKPGNILLKADGQPILIDFGASKQFGQTDGQSTSTAMAFTPGYAPSEQQEQNFSRIGAWTDLYALGATIYNLLTRKTPPSVSDIQNEEAAAFSFPAGVGDDMRRLVVSLMTPAYRRRPQSVSDVRAMLKGHSSTDASVPNEDEKTIFSGSNDAKVQGNPVKPSSRKWLIAILSCVLVGLLVFGVIFFVQRKNVQVDNLYALESVEPLAMDTITVNGVTFTMIKVQGGTFTMGATTEQGSDAYDDEKPAHRVTLSDYYIGQTEVTQALWQAVMDNNPSNWEGANLPVEQVSYDDCQEFISRLNQLTGRQFRLPTEAEWEYAARGGNKSRGYKYAGSNNVSDVAWYDGNSGDQTHPVAQKQPNELGLYDMAGNVWEWCHGWYGSYSSTSQTNSQKPSSASYRVSRGGGWVGNAGACRVSRRYDCSPVGRLNYLGLRLAL